MTTQELIAKMRKYQKELDSADLDGIRESCLIDINIRLLERGEITPEGYQKLLDAFSDV